MQRNSFARLKDGKERGADARDSRQRPGGGGTARQVTVGTQAITHEHERFPLVVRGDLPHVGRDLVEGGQALALGQQPRQFCADGGRLRLKPGHPGKLAVPEDGMVSHQRRLGNTMAQPVYEPEKDPRIDAGLAGRTRIDGLHNG
ncbi:hypothetical protein D9M70_567440 [compost metagenome]